MKIINAIEFNERNDWFNDDTLDDLRDVQSKDNYEVYDIEANEDDVVIPDIDSSDENHGGILADDYVMDEEPLSIIDDSLREVDELRRMQEQDDLSEEEPKIKTREEEADLDEVDESVAEETEIDERVPDFSSTEAAIEAAMEENRVMEIFYTTKGRGSRDEKRYLKRERGLNREDTGGVKIHRIIEPHYIYEPSPKKIKNPEDYNKIVVTYDRSVRRIRSFVINNIYDYNFTKNRKTKKDQYFKPRQRVMPSSGKGIQTMKNINNELTKIASTLDGKGLDKSASVVREAKKAIFNYKTAQYVGVQGYWLKNRRCWDNCYRNKRTSQPGTPAQTVWMECWDEYKDSINNNKSTWSKYAGTYNSLKTGGKIEGEWNRIFASKVEEKVRGGLNRPEAIFSVIEAESKAYSEKVIQASSDLMTLANTLVNSGQINIGKQMADMSIAILKEADIGGQKQNWIGKGVDKAKGFFGGMKGKGSKADVIQKIQNVISMANELILKLKTYKSTPQPNQNQPETTSYWGGNQSEPITGKTHGFIIEAGKGTRIVEAKDDVGDRMQQQKQQKIQQETDQLYNERKQEQNPKGDDDQDGVTNDQDVDDNGNNIADNQETQQTQNDPTQTDTDQDGKSDAEEAQTDTDQDGVTDDKDVDADGNNVADNQETQTDPAQKGKQQEGPAAALSQSYSSLVKDMASLSKELSGLQTAKDPQVAQYSKGAAPLLQNFVNNSKRGEGSQVIIPRLQQLATDLQGVLAGQAAAPQMGGQVMDQGGNVSGGDQMGNVPGGDQGGNVSMMAGKVSKLQGADQLAQRINAQNISSEDLEFAMNVFEKSGVPFNSASWGQFKNELAGAFQKAAVASVVWQKRK